jgi:hypothetical protein
MRRPVASLVDATAGLTRLEAENAFSLSLVRTGDLSRATELMKTLRSRWTSRRVTAWRFPACGD